MKFCMTQPEHLPVDICDIWNKFAKEDPRSTQATCPDGKWTDEAWAHNVLLRQRHASSMAISLGLESPLLEIGCGQGIYLRQWRDKHNLDVHGIDVCKVFQKMNSSRVSLCKGDGTIPCPDSFFRSILCINVFQHCLKKTIQKYIEEAHRVLRPEGQFYFTSPDLGSLNPNYHDEPELRFHGFSTKLYPLTFYMNELGKLGWTIDRIGFCMGNPKLYLIGFQCFKTPQAARRNTDIVHRFQVVRSNLRSETEEKSE